MSATVAARGRWRLRMSQAMVLAPRMARTIRWIAPTVGVAIGLVNIHQTAQSVTVDLARLLLAVRVAAVALCLGAAFALDDPATETLESAPASASYQRVLRIAIFLPGLVVGWVILIVYANSVGEPLPLGSLSLEFGALVAVTWAASAVATPRVPDGLGGVAAGPALMGFIGAAAFVRQLALFAGEPGDAVWAAAHRRWVWVLLIAIVVLIQSSRDPGRTRHGRRAIASFAGRMHSGRDAGNAAPLNQRLHSGAAHDR